ncbi:hypothetical protein GGI15_003527 [Coemansia interrupta]|uniref:Uncharacterized protein n=1 Tax=Coemansia interrupta TaxID=1126814 RepID=A0A9W8LHP0_9FUNG|nr:hypothetical protein GGI15_003527 [Coemansia interrupta]
MSRTTLSIVAVAWFLAASYVQAGPIAADSAATSSELASLGGLLQALGAGVIGNGALLYPTAASSHQRAESEILASDTVTRVYKKVKSALKDGGLGDDDDGGDDSSKSITYLVKPALIFHKEELPPPNPLAGNVLPLPGGALLYTPTPTANGGAAEPTNGPAASIKAAYGNLFAASPYTPSYTLNKPHAAVIVEEVTDMISLKSVQQREEDAGEDVADDDSDEEDEYGRKRRKKAVKIISLETIDSTSTFINPFTRADFPFGLITPTAAAPAPAKEATEESISKKSQKKTIKKTVSAKSTSTVAPASSSSQQLNASMGKDGGITVVNNGASASSQGTTIVIPAASLQSSTSAASSSSASAASSSSGSSASPASTSESAHEESSKNEDHSANEVTRFARTHKTSAKPDLAEPTKVGGMRRDAVVSSNDPLFAGTMDTQVASSLSSLAQGESKETASPSVTLGSATSPEQHLPETAASSGSADMPKRRKMHIVRVYEVKKNKHSGTVETMTVATSTSAEVMHKRDMMPVYEAQPTGLPMVDVPASSTSMMADGYPYPDIHVGYVQRMQREDDEDSDAEDASDAIEMSDADNVSDALEQSDAEEASVDRKAESKSAESSSASAASTSATASAESSSASASAVSSSASASAESTSAGSSAKDATVVSSATAASSSASAESTAAEAQSTSRAAHNTSAKSLSIETVDAPATSGTSVASSSATTVDSEKSESSDSDSDSDSESDNESDVKRNQESDSDSDNESDAKKDSGSDSDSDSDEKSKKRPADDSDDEKAPRRRHAISVVDADEDPFKAIQRIAAAGMREAEQAAVDYELHSDSDGIELLTTEDAVKHTSSLAANAEPTKVRAADDKDSDNDSDKEAGNEKDSESDSDSDDNKSGNKESDSDSDSDSDDESSKSPRKPKDTEANERMSTKQAPDVAGEDEREELAARKALSEALVESVKQAVDEGVTELENVASDSADSDFSGIVRDATDASDGSERKSASEEDDDYEYETHGGVNSDGDEVEFVTQLVADEVTKKAKVAESPSIVVMASIDEEYEEEYFTGASSTSAATAAGEVGHVQRNALDAQEDDVEEDKVIPGIEPTPDVGLIKESQNRAINIGLGNLRRHV